MTWHDNAVLASCSHYSEQLQQLPQLDPHQEPWRRALSSFHENPARGWNPAALPYFQDGGCRPFVNEATLGFGCSRDDAVALIFGLEPAYQLPEGDHNGNPKWRLCFAIEGCVLSALWQSHAGAEMVARIATDAAGGKWPAGIPDWVGLPDFCSNPINHFGRLPHTHTWRRIQQILQNDDFFNDYYLMDLGHMPHPRNQGTWISAQRLGFLTTVVRDYASDNPSGTLWFHGCTQPAADAAGPPGNLPVGPARAIRTLMDAFFAAPGVVPTHVVQVPPTRGGNYIRAYEHAGRKVVLSCHVAHRLTAAYRQALTRQLT